MTESACISLFAEMDHAADTLRKDNSSLRAGLRVELQLLFREIQKRRMPSLPDDEWLALFETWLTGFVAKLRSRHDEAIAGIARTPGEDHRSRQYDPPGRDPAGADGLHRQWH